MMGKVMRLKKTLTVAMMITVGVFNTLLMSSAMAQVTPKFSGEISVRGAVTLNGVNAASGATVFDASRIKTGNNGSATLNLGKLGQVELAPDSELVLKLDNGIVGGNLRSGRATVSVPAGIGINILTTEGTAVTEGNEASVMTVNVACGNTRVASAKSEAKVTAGNRIEVVSAGQEVSVGTQNAAPSCKRLPVVLPATGIASGALAALLIGGIGATIAGIVAATQGGDQTSVNISGFRP